MIDLIDDENANIINKIANIGIDLINIFDNGEHVDHQIMKVNQLFFDNIEIFQNEENIIKFIDFMINFISNKKYRSHISSDQLKGIGIFLNLIDIDNVNLTSRSPNRTNELMNYIELTNLLDSTIGDKPIEAKDYKLTSQLITDRLHLLNPIFNYLPFAWLDMLSESIDLTNPILKQIVLDAWREIRADHLIPDKDLVRIGYQMASNHNFGEPLQNLLFNSHENYKKLFMNICSDNYISGQYITDAIANICVKLTETQR